MLYMPLFGLVQANIRLASIAHIFLCEYDLAPLPNSIELNSRITFDCVRLSSIEIATLGTLKQTNLFHKTCYDKWIL